MSSPLINPNHLRQAYLDFFAKRGHAIVPSSRLVPENDPTTLFTSSGMQPMVPYLLGQPHPAGTRITDSQKSFRTQDIEEVGDNRHTTFFEMLGNWSLGDYFKHEQLTWFFTFLTNTVGLDPHHLYVTVFAGDTEAKVVTSGTAQSLSADLESIDIWKQLYHSVGITAEVVDQPERDGLSLPNARIFLYGSKKNWWSRSGEPSQMPAGEPGGPDSELFYDFGLVLGLHEKSVWRADPCHVNCDCGRFLEIGNNVFMQYQKQADGTLSVLPKKNVDFGGGLERILAAATGNPDVFTTQLFETLRSTLERLTGQKYGQIPETTRAMRLVMDHARAAVMLVADGVSPGSKEQGYFVRRLLRRALRYGDLLGLPKGFLPQLVAPVAQLYQQAYPAVAAQQKDIESVFTNESTKFETALQKGLRHIDKVGTLTEAVAFYLYESFGFPFELTAEIAAERGITLSLSIFEEERRHHAEASRTASAGKFKGGLQDQSETTVKYHTATHLLHAALRQTLGTHVQQQGSNITAERLRFDFSHTAAVTSSQLAQVEQQINAWISADSPVIRQIIPKDAALKQGALAFFGQKYPDEVSVYTIGANVDADWISKELCGGPHVTHTGAIGQIKIVKEQSVAAGVRRVYLALVST